MQTETSPGQALHTALQAMVALVAAPDTAAPERLEAARLIVEITARLQFGGRPGALPITAFDMDFGAPSEPSISLVRSDGSLTSDRESGPAVASR